MHKIHEYKDFLLVNDKLGKTVALYAQAHWEENLLDLHTNFSLIGRAYFFKDIVSHLMRWQEFKDKLKESYDIELQSLYKPKWEI